MLTWSLRAPALPRHSCGDYRLHVYCHTSTSLYVVYARQMYRINTKLTRHGSVLNVVNHIQQALQRGKEIERRLSELDSSEVQSIPWESVRARLSGKLEAVGYD